MGKIIAACSLSHPENECQRHVNSVSCCIFGHQGIALLFVFITKLLTALIGKIQSIKLETPIPK